MKVNILSIVSTIILSIALVSGMGSGQDDEGDVSKTYPEVVRQVNNLKKMQSSILTNPDCEWKYVYRVAHYRLQKLSVEASREYRYDPKLLRGSKVVDELITQVTQLERASRLKPGNGWK
ncbi:hypothetical protein FRC02_000283 [Tulasnella sp. 418]|nr:hypothetical protein FRC02_000283 [Tulasnella sp. 418]